MKKWWKWIAGAVVGAVAIQGIVAIENHRQPSPAQAASPNDDKAAAARFEQCRSNLKMAAAAQILHDLDVKRGADPYVVVGPGYFALRSAQKKDLADNVNCFLAAGDNNCIGFDLRDWRTDKPVARYSLCRLEPVD